MPRATSRARRAGDPAESATGSYHDDGGRAAAPQLKISPSPLHWYDAVFDVQALSLVLHGGWRARLAPALRHAPPSVLRGLRAAAYDGLRKDGAGARPIRSPRVRRRRRRRAGGGGGGRRVRSIPGRVDRGGGPRTVQHRQDFRPQQADGAGAAVVEAGCDPQLALRRATLERTSTDVTLIDSEGSLAPAPINKLRERQATEHFLEEMTAKLGDYLLYMVDDFTSFDQRAIHRLSRKVSEAAASKPAHSRGGPSSLWSTTCGRWRMSRRCGTSGGCR